MPMLRAWQRVRFLRIEREVLQQGPGEKNHHPQVEDLRDRRVSGLQRRLGNLHRHFHPATGCWTDGGRWRLPRGEAFERRSGHPTNPH
jgi:hypothetical protein